MRRNNRLGRRGARASSTWRAPSASGRRGGNVLVLTAFGLVTMVGCCALAVDYGLLVSDANRTQRALDAAALAGAQDLKQSTDAADQVRARDTAVLTAAQNGLAINKDTDVSFESGGTVISVKGSASRPYYFARIFNSVAPGSPSGGSVSRRAKARVASCAALNTLSPPHVVPIGITWDTYGGLDPAGYDHPMGYRNDWETNRQFLDQPSRMTYRVLTLTRQNATTFGKDDYVLFDLRNSPAKSGAHFLSQITGDAAAQALSGIGDYETTLNASDSSQGSKLSDAFTILFQRAASLPWNDATSDPMINAVGIRYPDILGGNSVLNANGQPNPRLVSLVITSAPTSAPVNGSWNTQIQGYAPVYVRRAFATMDAITGQTLLQMEVGFLPPQSNSNGMCDANTGAVVSGQRITGLIQ